jgi:hypothetical protein
MPDALIVPPYCVSEAPTKLQPEVRLLSVSQLNVVPVSRMPLMCWSSTITSARPPLAGWTSAP